MNQVNYSITMKRMKRVIVLKWQTRYIKRNDIAMAFLFLAGIWIVNPRNSVSVNGEKKRNLTKYLMRNIIAL